jgi:hypothetical protein
MHSLWYELVNLLLHQALADLDDAMTAVPEPVRTAIDAELEAEARGLRDALAEFSEGISPPATENRRHWDFGSPSVAFDGGMDALSREIRERLDRHEEGITIEDRQKGVADLRLLVDAYTRYRGDQATLEAAEFTIFDDPFGPDRYFLTVDAPRPGDDDVGGWRVEIDRWEPDDPEDEECNSASGSSVLSCTCSAPPTAAEVADLLNRSAERPEQLTAWAETPVGEALAGTTFVVTERAH